MIRVAFFYFPSCKIHFLVVWPWKEAAKKQEKDNKGGKNYSVIKDLRRQIIRLSLYLP